MSAESLVRRSLHLFFRVFHAIQFHGTRNVPATGPVLLAANHPSYMDPLVLGLGVERLVRFFALRTLLDVPFVGWFSRKWGMLPVTPGGDNEPSVRKALRILARGGAVGIFPEGRRSRQFAMGPVKPGIGRLAAQSGAVLVPCVIYGTWKAWPIATGLPHPAKIVVDYLPPLEVDRTDTPENHARIAERVREVITAEQARHRVGPAPAGALREAPDY